MLMIALRQIPLNRTRSIIMTTIKLCNIIFGIIFGDFGAVKIVWKYSGFGVLIFVDSQYGNGTVLKLIHNEFKNSIISNSYAWNNGA